MYAYIVPGSICAGVCRETLPPQHAAMRYLFQKMCQKYSKFQSGPP